MCGELPLFTLPVDETGIDRDGPAECLLFRIVWGGLARAANFRNPPNSERRGALMAVNCRRKYVMLKALGKLKVSLADHFDWPVQQQLVLRSPLLAN